MPPKKQAKKRASKDQTNQPPTKLPRASSVNTQLKAAIAAVVKEEPTASSAKLEATFSSLIGGGVPTVHGEYACMLNQTDIINNNNKFYVIQLAKKAKNFHLFTRWGRVGEPGQNSIDLFSSEDDAIKGFQQKFQQKTGNKWDNRANFAAKLKKYTLLAMDTADSDADEGGDVVDGASVVVKRELEGGSNATCTLDTRTQMMIKVIFSDHMFQRQMEEMSLDVRKMPLGKLSKVQIAKGLEALIALEEAVKSKASAVELARLSSAFFTLIPHSFGRHKPPILSNTVVIQQKKDVMLTLSDIELTQSLQKKKKKSNEKHPLDVHYESLSCGIELLENKSKEFKVISDYVKGTGHERNKLLDVWCLDREGESSRFSVNNKISVRKLLWHGTNVAVVAAILNSGLRIMPHSGGAVGKGIYFASEHSKSAGYAGGYNDKLDNDKHIYFMFLSEVALGNMKNIMCCDGSIVKAPPGYDSVVGKGKNEPNPAKDVVLQFDGRPVNVPVGKPVPQKGFTNSVFWQSEYLVYNEHQVRLRFLLKFQSGN